MVTAETPNCAGQVGDPGAAVLLDDPGDVLLALPGEDVVREAVAGIGHASPLAPRGLAHGSGLGCFDWFPRHSSRDRNAMSRR